MDEVQQVTFNGRLARKKGQRVVYITERAVFRLEPQGPVLIEVAPGLEPARDILPNVGFELQTARELREMDPAIFRSERMGLKQREPWRE
ncbi:MAG: hypothetical protein JRH07_19075 [Deltaproteobacteria bacterium]|nr:hypothetical protein [Deltaproteobacteria bacterium]